MAAIAARNAVWGHGISLFLTDDAKPATEKQQFHLPPHWP
jgi:hypothetical protein